MASEVPTPEESKPHRTWQEIAREVTHEENPAKMIKLCTELNEAMLDEEREKARRRIGLIKPQR